MSQAISVAIQLGTIPILLGIWGDHRYGEWVLLSTIPGQLALSDLGFGSAASNEMTMRVGRNDRRGALATFQSAWVLVTLLSLAASALAITGLLFLPWHQWFNFENTGQREATIAGLCLVVQVIFQQQLTLATAGYACDGRYARGVMANNLLRLSTVAGAMAMLSINRDSLAWYASGSLAATFLVGVFTLIDLKRTVPWLSVGWANANRQEIKKLWSPAVSFLGFPFGLVLGAQAINLVIGRFFGVQEVTHFATLRTLSRVVVQGTSIFSAPFTVELSRTLGAGKLVEARQLHARSCQASVFSGVIFTTILAVFGEWIYRFFTHGLEFRADVFSALLVLGMLNSVWTASCSVPISINRHQGFTVAFLVSNACAFGLMLEFAPRFGLLGVAIGLAFVELVMNFYTLTNSLRHLQQSFGDFCQMFFQNPIPALVASIRRDPAMKRGFGSSRKLGTPLATEMTDTLPNMEKETTESMTRPLVSIVTPLYNHRRFLERTVDGVLNQTYSNWEWIVCDDGSSDGSYEFMQEVAAREPRITLLRNEKNSKIVITTQRCMDLARGEYMYILDSDDYAFPEYLDTMVDLLEANPECSVGFCRCFTMDDKDGYWGAWPKRPDFKRNGVQEFHNQLFGYSMKGTTTLYRLSMCAEIGGWASHPLTRMHDKYYDLRALLQGDVVYIDKPLGCYRIHATNHHKNMDEQIVPAIAEEVFGMVEDLAERVPANPYYTGDQILQDGYQWYAGYISHLIEFSDRKGHLEESEALRAMLEKRDIERPKPFQGHKSERVIDVARPWIKKMTYRQLPAVHLPFDQPKAA
jgi:O-antigen/teichoic acid export membrane protein/GT2 family glycosyltransferase